MGRNAPVAHGVMGDEGTKEIAIGRKKGKMYVWRKEVGEMECVVWVHSGLERRVDRRSKRDTETTD